MKALTLVFLLPMLGAAGNAGSPIPTALVQTISLPKVTGRIDHMALDAKGQRLFIAALGNNSVEVVDLVQGKVIRSLNGFKEPQGVVYVPGKDQLYVASGGDGAVRIFEGPDFQPVQSLDFHEDADNLRYDEARRKVYVGYGSGGIASIDALTGKVDTDIKLSAHPESFQLMLPGNRIFVNVPDDREIVVLNREKKVVEFHWPTGSLHSNFPMALDDSSHRLFVGFRGPPALGVFDTETGKSVAQLPIDSDIDDVAYDSKGKRIFLSCGGGYLDVFLQSDPDHYQSIGRVPTSKGARTSLLDTESGRLYVAAPSHWGREAYVLVFTLNF